MAGAGQPGLSILTSVSAEQPENAPSPSFISVEGKLSVPSSVADVAMERKFLHSANANFPIETDFGCHLKMIFWILLP